MPRVLAEYGRPSGWVPDGFLPAGTRRATRSSMRPRATSPTSTTARSPRSARCTRSSASRRRARPHELVGLALPRAARSAHGARHERRRARGEPAGEGVGRARPQRRPGPAVRRRRVRPRDVLRVGRLPHAAGRGVPRRRAGRAPGGLFVCTFSNRLFPDQGDPRLARTRRCDATRRSSPSTFAAPAVSNRPSRADV